MDYLFTATLNKIIIRPYIYFKLEVLKQWVSCVLSSTYV